MIELLYSIVGARAGVSHGALVMNGAIGDVLAGFRGVGTKRSSAVLLGLVIEEALFRIVLVGNFTLLSLEVIEIQVSDHVIISWLKMVHILRRYLVLLLDLLKALERAACCEQS